MRCDLATLSHSVTSPWAVDVHEPPYWAKRHRTWAGHGPRSRAGSTQCCGLVPGQVSKRISAVHAARVLSQVTVSGAVARARCELAGDFPGDLRRIDARMREARKKLAAAVQASGTTLTAIFGVGPVVAAVVIGEAGDPARFAGCPGAATAVTATLCTWRRSPRSASGIATAALATTIRSPRARPPKEALRALKRQVSDAIFKHLKADAARAAARSGQGPGGHQGNDSVASAAGLHPEHRLFGQATPGPDLTL